MRGGGGAAAVGVASATMMLDGGFRLSFVWLKLRLCCMVVARGKERAAVMGGESSSNDNNLSIK